MALHSVTEIAGALLTAIAVGGMLFFATVFAPKVFRNLAPDPAVQLISQVLPLYYGVLTGLTALAALALWSRREAPVLAVVAVLFIFARYALMPPINRQRDIEDADDVDEVDDQDYGAEDEAFIRLHHLGVLIGFAQMAALLAVFLRLVSS